MILFLVRHALTPVTGQKLTGRLPGHSLSDQGRAQAEATARRLAGAPLGAIYSSPMERCVETAEVIARHHRVGVEICDAVNEIDYGRWSGRSFKALHGTKGWAELKKRPADFRFPGGETIREAQTRGMSAVEDLVRRHRNRAVVVCTHADMVRLLVAGYLGASLDLYDRVHIAPASITTLVLGDGSPQLFRAGDTGGYDDLYEILRSRKEAASRPAPTKGRGK